MKKILLIPLLLLSLFTMGQTVVEPGSVAQPTSQFWIKNQPDSVNMRVYVYFGAGKYAIRVPRWQDLISAAATIPGGPISSIPTIGFNPGTNISASDFIKNVFYQSQPPTATLTGGTIHQLSTTNYTHNLSYSYGRQASTTTISTAVITPGPLNVFTTQPAQPGIVSGTQSVTTTANTNTTYIITVTTTDGKTATAITTDTWLPGRYWGRSATTSPNNAAILSIAGGGTDLNGSRAKSGFVITASGSNYIYYAYPSSQGALTSLTIGGFESLPAFTQNTVSVTNSDNYVQNYFVYVSNNTFSATTPNIIAQ